MNPTAGSSRQAGRVRTGLETWLDGSVVPDPLARGANVGLLVHAASVDAALQSTVERVLERPGLRVVRIFAPEHGVWGEAQDMEPVDGAADPETGLPVVSLYGREVSSLKPRPEHLAGLDVVVTDLQDVGARYYTFVYTLAYMMEACGEAGIPLVVLDRPNPLGGVRVEGPVLDPAWSSFVGRFPLPVVHGLTCAELARWFRRTQGIRCELHVVPMTGWRRGMGFEETGLPWVPPSPNMPTLDTVRVYPGGCLLEGTNLSEGRGTTKPFEWFGAPYVQPSEVIGILGRDPVPGARLRKHYFRPRFHKHAGRTCAGFQLHVLDPQAFRPFEAYLKIIQAVARTWPGAFDWRREPYEFESERLAMDLLLGRGDLRERLVDGEPVEAMAREWEEGLEAFRRERAADLLYP